MLHANAGEPTEAAESLPDAGGTLLPAGYSQAEFDQLVDRFITIQAGGRKVDAGERARTRDALLAVLVTSSQLLPPLPVPATLVALHDAAARAWGIRPGGTVVGGAARDAAGEPADQVVIAQFNDVAGMPERMRDSNARFAVEAVRYVRGLIDRQRNAR